MPPAVDGMSLALSLVLPWRTGSLVPVGLQGPPQSSSELTTPECRKRVTTVRGLLLESEFESEIFSFSDGRLLPLLCPPPVAPAKHVLSLREQAARQPREGDSELVWGV